MELEEMKALVIEKYNGYIIDMRKAVGNHELRWNILQNCIGMLNLALNLKLLDIFKYDDLFDYLLRERARDTDEAIKKFEQEEASREDKSEEFIEPELDATLPFSEIEVEPEAEAPFTFGDILNAVTPSQEDYEKHVDDIPQPYIGLKFDSAFYNDKLGFFRKAQDLIRRHNCYAVAKHPSAFIIGDSYKGLCDFFCDAVSHGIINDCEANRLEDMILVGE